MVLIMTTRSITGIIMPIMDWVVSNPSVCEDFLLYILNIKCYFKNFAASKFYVGKPKTSILSKHATNPILHVICNAGAALDTVQVLWMFFPCSNEVYFTVWV